MDKTHCNNGKVNYVYKAILDDFFQEIEALVVPRATRVVTNRVLVERNSETDNTTIASPVELREDDEDVYVAGKGGNAVASMIMQHIQEHLVEENKEPLKEINLVMDNCGGQNKNRHVLRLLNVIVQRKIAKRVNAIFLVKGHTKNPCDRMFNILKKHTCEANIYTPKMLMDACNTQEGVTPAHRSIRNHSSTTSPIQVV